MSAPWQVDRLLRPRAGHGSPLQIVDAEAGRVVCVIPGHLERQATPETVVRLLDDQDAANGRLIAAAPQLRSALAELVEWSTRTGEWEAPCWRQARALLSRLRTPPDSA